MVNIEKISNQILNDGLYNTLLFEIKESEPMHNITPKIIERALIKNPSLIQEYKEINRQSEISSIQVKKLVIKDEDSETIADFKTELNQNIQILKNLENFETDSKNSAYAIWIGSVGVTVLFMVHNIIALFSELYVEAPSLVYGSYIVILYLTYIMYLKIKRNHDAQHGIFQNVYTKTQEMLQYGLEASYFTRDEVYEK